MSLKPSTGLVIGGIRARLELENVNRIQAASELKIYVGGTAVDPALVRLKEVYGSRNIVLIFTIPAGSTVGVAAVQVVFAEWTGQPDTECFSSPCFNGGFVYTTITGPAVVTFGPSPSSIRSTSVETIVRLGASNFLPVTDFTQLELHCIIGDNSIDPSFYQITRYSGSASESFFALTLAAFHPAVGVAACQLQQSTGTQNLVSFELTITAPQISVSQVRPAASVGVGTAVSVQILNLGSANLFWEETVGVWSLVSLTSSVTKERIAQDSNGLWEGGVEVKFSMFDADISGAVTIAVRTSGVDNKATFVLDFVKDSPRLISVSPKYGSVCGGSTITASFSDADVFSLSGLVLRAFDESSGYQDVAANTWDSVASKITFTVPKSISESAGIRQMQVQYAPDSFVSSNFSFEYHLSTPLILATSPKSRNGTLSLIPTRMPLVTVQLEDLDVLMQDDLSLTLSGVDLTVAKFRRIDGLITLKFTPPSDTSIGLKVLTIA